MQPEIDVINMEMKNKIELFINNGDLSNPNILIDEYSKLLSNYTEIISMKAISRELTSSRLLWGLVT